MIAECGEMEQTGLHDGPFFFLNFLFRIFFFLRKWDLMHIPLLFFFSVVNVCTANLLENRLCGCAEANNQSTNKSITVHEVHNVLQSSKLSIRIVRMRKMTNFHVCTYYLVHTYYVLVLHINVFRLN